MPAYIIARVDITDPEQYRPITKKPKKSVKVRQPVSSLSLKELHPDDERGAVPS